MYYNPIRFEKTIDRIYHLEVDIGRDDCNREKAHWHLCERGRRIAQIFIDPVHYECVPCGVQQRVVNEALELTECYSRDIREAYLHNKVFGAA